jgi:drug/metabolite transporter (DMT)-like permease
VQRELTAGVLLAVLGAGVLHACWNAILKAVSDRLVAFAWMGVAFVLAAPPVLAVTGLPAREAIVLGVVSAAIHVGYDFSLMNAYRLGSFNQMSPVARGSCPLLVALGAALFVGGRPGALSLAGIVVLAAGLTSLALSSGRFNRSELPALGAALLTGVTIATYSVIDGVAVRHSGNALSYTAFVFLLEGPVFVLSAAVRRRPAGWVADRVAWRGVLAGLLSAAAYGIVLWAQTRAPLAVVSALRETGVLSAAVIGALFFKERFGGRRLGAAAVVALGVLLIGL